MKEGVVRSISQYDDARDGIYWQVTIDSESYRAWDRRLLKGIQAGDRVVYRSVGEGAERDILALEPTSRQVQTGVPLDARELYIRYTYDRQPRDVRIKLDKGKAGQYSWELSYEGEDAEQVIQALRQVDARLKEEFGG